MNHNCHGDYFPTLGMYRCMADGTFIEVVELPQECEHCKRVVSATIHPTVETRTVSQVAGPFGWETYH